jgi:hypothetical protein
MAKRLLDRQASLLAYLTSDAAIFGHEAGAARDPALRGIDPSLLHLEARFSHEKRMEKIVAAFPRTVEILGDRKAALFRQFAQACPPIDISRLVNAGQFCEFLRAREQRKCLPPYLGEVAACELACLKVRPAIEERDDGARMDNGKRSRRAIRRSPGIALLRCEYDIRPIFERASSKVDPERRDTPLAVAARSGLADPQIFEVMPVVFELLTALDDWTDPAAFGDTPEVDALIAELLAHGLIEAHR